VWIGESPVPERTGKPRGSNCRPEDKRKAVPLSDLDQQEPGQQDGCNTHCTGIVPEDPAFPHPDWTDGAPP
jgi:hypothetical protein